MHTADDSDIIRHLQPQSLQSAQSVDRTPFVGADNGLGGILPPKNVAQIRRVIRRSCDIIAVQYAVDFRACPEQHPIRVIRQPVFGERELERLQTVLRGAHLAFIGKDGDAPIAMRKQIFDLKFRSPLTSSSTQLQSKARLYPLTPRSKNSEVT